MNLLEEDRSCFILRKEQEPDVTRILDQIKIHLPSPLATPPVFFLIIVILLKSVILVNWYFWIIRQCLLMCLDTSHKIYLQIQSRHSIPQYQPGYCITLAKSTSWMCLCIGDGGTMLDIIQ